jgi:hypothetical protein
MTHIKGKHPQMTAQHGIGMALNIALNWQQVTGHS